MSALGLLQDLLARKVLLPPSAKSPQDPDAFQVQRVKDKAVLHYRIQYHAVTTHRPVFRQIELPLSFYEKRKGRLLDEVEGELITVVEFGVWRGAFLENLAIHAEETGKKLRIFGFDTFEEFPDRSTPGDLKTRTLEKYHLALETTKPFPQEEIKKRLGTYSSIAELHWVAGDITRLTPAKIAPDLVHFDMDLYEPFFSAMKWIGNVRTTRLIVDDYYQPSWTGMVDAVNGFAGQHGLYPVNLSDYFRVERSHRTQWISLLLPLLR
ncbi:MAG: hypothetical protein HYZ90_02920 [Candidatus Omnitrophica bacterium]|nr:hypothetical protein [Candidatus Omnitrophota bacterium]